MQALEPSDPDFEARIRESFSRQLLMPHLGAEISRVEPGEVEVQVACRPELTQQHGYIHAGVVGAIADTAGGYAALSLLPADASVLAVEYKINLLAPAAGERIVAIGRVLRAGRTLTICSLTGDAVKDGTTTRCAVGQQTIINLHGTPDRPKA